jgi:catechol 2,3-dioxygenase
MRPLMRPPMRRDAAPLTSAVDERRRSTGGMMGAGTRDLFGDGGGAQPALAGSYGEPPSGARLPEGLALGRVVLQVASLARSIAFYEQVLGLRVVGREAASATNPARAELAPHRSERTLVELRETPGARPAPRRGRTGLFHFAILLPDRPSLGRFVAHLGGIGVQAGAGDHLVSEAFYLSDPDGLGIEVYADRPRSTWRRVGRELMMATDPVDVAGLVAAAGNEPWRGMPAGTVMGHLHLHVGDIAQGAQFYGETIGFDRMAWSYPGALFFGANGYHHHLGTNIWAGSGAKAAPPDEAQLVEWTIELPDDAAVAAVAKRLGTAPTGGGFVARDPWGTAVRIQRSPARSPRSA